VIGGREAPAVPPIVEQRGLTAANCIARTRNAA